MQLRQVDSVKIMVDIFLAATLAAFATFFIIYGSYVLLILKNPKKTEYIHLIDRVLLKPLPSQDLPNVSILVPTYNEETAIRAKLQNLADLDYPLKKLEVLLLDDCSSDRTCEIAQEMFKKLRLSGRIFRNSHRLGANASYNKGVPNASYDLILRTDADVTIEADSLEKAVKILRDVSNIGGVTAKTSPVMSEKSLAAKVEGSYLSLFNEMLIAESAIHSTFPGYGGFALLKRSCFSPIPVQSGSTDGNISLSIIKKGFRFIYVPHIIFYETIPHTLREQRKQKARRATRMIQSALVHRNILFHRESGEFGKKIFPLRLAMLTLCPLLMVVGLVSAFLAVLAFLPILGVSLAFVASLLLYVGTKLNISLLNSLSSLLIHQLYLLLGLFSAGRRTSTWMKPKKQVHTTAVRGDNSD